MKNEISIFARWFLMGSQLMARAAAQGIAQALVSTAIEWSVNKFNAAAKMISRRSEDQSAKSKEYRGDRKSWFTDR